MPTIDILLKKISNKFLLANAIAQRAKELGEGSLPYIEDSNPLNHIETAMNEIANNKLELRILEGPAPKPIKVIEAKAKDFWTIDNLERKEHKKAKKPSKKK